MPPGTGYRTSKLFKKFLMPTTTISLRDPGQVEWLRSLGHALLGVRHSPSGGKVFILSAEPIRDATTDAGTSSRAALVNALGLRLALENSLQQPGGKKE
jgi:hypothetical protein